MHSVSGANRRDSSGAGGTGGGLHGLHVADVMVPSELQVCSPVPARARSAPSVVAMGCVTCVMDRAWSPCVVRVCAGARAVLGRGLVWRFGHTHTAYKQREGQVTDTDVLRRCTCHTDRRNSLRCSRSRRSRTSSCYRNHRRSHSWSRIQYRRIRQKSRRSCCRSRSRRKSHSCYCSYTCLNRCEQEGHATLRPHALHGYIGKI